MESIREIYPTVVLYSVYFEIKMKQLEKLEKYQKIRTRFL